MKITIFTALFFMITGCLLNAQVPNDINNGSFEEFVGEPPNVIDVNDWVFDGQPPEILQTRAFYDKDRHLITIEPVDGNYFVLLKSGGGDAGWYSRLRQAIDVNAGDTISGVYFFATIDWMPNWNDAATIKLLPDPCSSLSEIILAYQDVNSVVYYGGPPGGAMDGWARFSRTIDSNEAGSYTIELKVADAIDRAYSSYLAVDALRITAAPPEPWCAHKLAGDINRDCKVDFVDFAMMAANWLIDCSIEYENPACVPK